MLNLCQKYALVAGVAVALGASVSSASVTWSATVGSRSASAVFTTSGTTLTILLSNDATSDALVPIDVLTGIFFDVSGGALSLTRTSVVVAPGSSVLNGTTDPGNVVGGEFAYRGGLSGAPHGAAYGVSSAGLGLFGPGDLFPGSNLNGPASPDGIQYGLTTAGDNPATGNGGINSEPLIKNAVLITLDGLPSGFDLARIGNVSFQYGTALDEPNIPTPGALSLLGLGGLLAARRRR